MKIALLTSLLIFAIFSCSPSKLSKTTTACNENEMFKKEFFQNIENIEKLITKSQNESFKNSLKFIAKYSHVSFEDMLNYANIYPITSLEKDKKVWLTWYEANKCNNIQFK